MVGTDVSGDVRLTVDPASPISKATAAIVDGVATFNNVAIGLVGRNRRLIASLDGFADAVSEPFTVHATDDPSSPPLAVLEVSAASVTAGGELTFKAASSGVIASQHVEIIQSFLDGNVRLRRRRFDDVQNGEKLSYTFDTPGDWSVVLTAVGVAGTNAVGQSIEVFPVPKLPPSIAGVELFEDEATTVDLRGLDEEAGVWSAADVDGDLLEIAVDGERLLIEPVDDRFGVDVITLTRTNPQGGATSREMEITILPVDDAPVIVDLPTHVDTDEDVAIVVGGPTYIADIDSEASALVWSASGFDEELVAAAVDGSDGVTFTPRENAFGTTLAEVTASDPASGESDSRIIELTWNPTDDPIGNPVALFPANAAVDVGQTPRLTWQVPNPDGDPLQHSVELFTLNSGESASNLSDAAFSPARLKPLTNYGWRVTARTDDGQVVSRDFSFTTGPDLAPPQITRTDLQMIRNDDGSWVAELSWSTDEGATGSVEYWADVQGEDPEVSSQAAVTSDDGQQHRARIEGLVARTRYGYRITASDLAAPEPNQASRSGRFRTRDETVALSIEPGWPGAVGRSDRSLTVRWVTSRAADGLVRYRPAGGEWLEITAAEATVQHEFELLELAPATVFEVEISSSDGAGSEGDAASFATLAIPDERPPGLLRLPSIAVTEETANIQVTADEPCRVELRYLATTESEEESVLVGGGTLVVRPAAGEITGSGYSFDLSELEAGSRYVFALQLEDAAGNIAQFPDEGEESAFFRTPAAGAAAGPQLDGSLPAADPETVGATTATVRFATSAPARSRVLYGPLEDPALHSAEGLATPRRRHQIELRDLTPNIRYLFEVEVWDGAFNSTFVGADENGAPLNFKTLDMERELTPPGFAESPIALEPTDTRAWIVMRLSRDVSGRISYGPCGDETCSAPYAVAGVVPLTDPDPDDGGRTTVPLSHLEPQIDYWYQVVLDAEADPVTSGVGTFRTVGVDATPPAFEELPALDEAGARSATITLRLTEAGDATLRWGMGGDLGQGVVTSDRRGKEHRLRATGLSPNTTYDLGVKARDAAGNATAEFRFTVATATDADDTAPLFVSGPAAVDVGGDRVRIRWSLDEPAEASVELSRVGAAGSLSKVREILTLQRVRDHSLEFTGLEAGSEYELLVTATNAGRLKSAATLRFSTLGGDVEVAPVVEAGPIVQEVTRESLALFWITSAPTLAEVVYHPVGLPEAALTRVQSRPQSEHHLLLTGLEPGTEYAVTVQGTDSSGNRTAVHEVPPPRTTATLAADLTPVVIGVPVVEEVGLNAEAGTGRATVRWRTQRPATSRVAYRTSSGAADEVRSGALVTEHGMTLTGLQPGETYSFDVISANRNGDSATAAGLPFTVPVDVDVTPPGFSARPGVLGRTGSAITLAWATSEPAAVRVEWGTTTELGLGSKTDPGLKLEREWRLNGLEPEAQYFVRVSAWDAAGNGPTVFPPDGTAFAVTTSSGADAIAPVIVGGPFVSRTDANQAIVEWSTDEPTSGLVGFGRDGVDAYVAQPRFRRDHQVVLTDLDAAQTYTYWVEAVDVAGNGPVRSAAHSFRTRAEAEQNRPRITFGPQAEVSSTAAATLVWHTSEPTTAAVEYGATNAYGLRFASSAITSEHRVTLQGLEPGTIYHYKITGVDLAGLSVDTDPAGRQLWSADHRFTTLQTPAAAPVLVESPAITLAAGGGVVGWRTDVPATSRIEWRGGGQADFVEDNRLVTEHALRFTGLQPRTEYEITVISAGVDGNGFTWPGLASAKGAVAAKVAGILNEDGLFLTPTSADETAPTIVGGPRVEERTDTSLRISWETDEPADSFVDFGPTADLGLSAGDPDDAVEHVVTVNELEPGQLYHFRAASTDFSGNGPVVSEAGVAQTRPEPDLVAPLFEEPPRRLFAGDREAFVAWSTDEAAAARLDVTAATGGATRTWFEGERRREQMARITQLEPGTSYRIAVTATDAGGNETTAPVLAVRTAEDPDIRLPNVAKPVVEAIGDRWVRVRWTSDEPTDGFVEFNPVFAPGEQPEELEPVRRVVDRTVALAHQVTLTQLSPGQRYILQVGANDLAGNGPVRSTIVRFKTLDEPDSEAPAAPLDLAALASGEAVWLRWTANTEADLDGYNVYREADGLFDPIATLVAEASYLDYGLDPGQTYRYRVTAVDGQRPYNESEASAADSATTPLQETVEVPVVVRLENGPDAVLPIAVVENVSTLSEDPVYAIQVASVPDFSDVVARSSRIPAGAIGQTRWLVDQVLDADTAYWWRARVIDGVFEGPWGEGAELTPADSTPIPGRTLVGDFNGDGAVDFFDFFAFADGLNSSDPLFDLDDDGIVGFRDLFVFVDHFGESAAGKEISLQTPSMPTLPGSRLQPEATIEGDLVTLDLPVAGASGVRGIGMRIDHDASLDYVGVVDSVGWGAAEAVRLSLPETGRLYLGQHLTVPGLRPPPGTRVQFRLRGIPRSLEFRVQEAVIALGPGRAGRLQDVGETSVLPQSYALWPNYPNPFNPSTTITFAVPSGPHRIETAILRLYNIQGQVVREWPLHGYGTGIHSLVWEGRDGHGREVASGVYLSLLQAGRFRHSHKLLLLK